MNPLLLAPHCQNRGVCMNELLHPLTPNEFLDGIALPLFYFDQSMSNPSLAGVPQT